MRLNDVESQKAVLSVLHFSTFVSFVGLAHYQNFRLKHRVRGSRMLATNIHCKRRCRPCVIFHDRKLVFIMFNNLARRLASSVSFCNTVLQLIGIPLIHACKRLHKSWFTVVFRNSTEVRSEGTDTNVVA
jgi:uncharacterized membrane protein YobD (UPF0266 family)